MIPTRWLMLALLYLARIALGFQFQTVATLAPQIREDLGLGYAALGTLIGLYMLPGLVVALPSGLLSKRFGDLPVALAGLACMAAGGVVVGLADGFAQACAGRLLSGVGAIVIGVTMVKMITDWFAGKEVILASNMYFSGFPFGVAIGLVVQPWLAELWSWREVLFVSAAALAVSLLLTAVLYRPAPDAAPPAAAGATTRLFSLDRQELVLVSLIGLVWAASSAAYMVILGFTPSLLIERGMSTAEAGQFTSLQIWISLIAMPVSGTIAQRLNRPNAIIAVCFLVTGAMVIAVPLLETPLLPFIVMGLIGGMPSGVIIAVASEVLRPESRAPGLGVYYTWFYFGMGGAPAVAGVLRDLTGVPIMPFLFAGAMVWSSLLLLIAFRMTQRSYARAAAH